MDLKERVEAKKVIFKNLDLSSRILSIGAVGLLLFIIYFLFKKDFFITRLLYSILRVIGNLIGIIIG